MNFQPRYFLEGGKGGGGELSLWYVNFVRGEYREYVTAPLSIKRTRVFEIRSIKVRVPHGLCARQPYTSGIDVRAYWIRWNDYIRVCMELVRKLCINGIARKTRWLLYRRPIVATRLVCRQIRQIGTRQHRYTIMSFELCLYFILRNIFDRKEK